MGEHGDFAKYENLEVVTRVPLLVYVPGITDGGESRKQQGQIFPFQDVLKNPKAFVPNTGEQFKVS